LLHPFAQHDIAAEEAVAAALSKGAIPCHARSNPRSTTTAVFAMRTVISRYCSQEPPNFTECGTKSLSRNAILDWALGSRSQHRNPVFDFGSDVQHEG
jgi:hypothetical protein